MINVLGLPLEEALEKLSAAGVGNILTERYAAPRAKDARGTLRVVRQNEDGTFLTVCAFSGADEPDTEI